MSLIPYKKFTIYSKSDINQLRQNLAYNIAPIGSNYLHGGMTFNLKRKFEGDIFDDSFKIRRQVSGLNSFVPVVLGKIGQEENKSIISVKIRLHVFVVILSILWLIGALIGLFTYLIPSLIDKTMDVGVIFSGLIVCVGYSILIVTFNLEKDKAKRELKNIFDGTIK